jgi:hypothetical protein
LVVKSLQLLLPVRKGIRMEKVRKVRLARPHGALFVAPGCRLDEHIHGHAIVKRRIRARCLRIADARIENHHVALAILVQLIDELLHLVAGVVDRICRKVQVAIEQINVVPLHILGQLVCAHRARHRPSVIQSDITPSAEMESQRPVRGHEGLADEIRVLLDDFDGRRTEEHVKVQHATNGAPVGRVGLQLDVHGIAVEQENTVCIAIRLDADHERVYTVQIRPARGRAFAERRNA